MENVVLCADCFEKEPKKQNFEHIEAKMLDMEELLEKNPGKLKEQVQDTELQKLVDEYYDLDFEDVIAGGIKTKFKYIDVEK